MVFLQIVGPATPTKWYDRSSLWGIIGVGISFIGSTMNSFLRLSFPAWTVIPLSLSWASFTIASGIIISDLVSQRTIRVLMQGIASVLIAVFFWFGVAYLNRREKKIEAETVQKIWRVTSCELVKDFPAAACPQAACNGKFTLNGPSRVQIIDQGYRGCYFPVGAEFHRDGNYMCEKSYQPNVSAAGYAEHCLFIQSEISN